MADALPDAGACSCCRRGFLRAVGAAAGGMALGCARLATPVPDAVPTAADREPATVRAAFIYPPSARLRAPGGWWSWPGNDFDAEGQQATYTRRLAEIARRLGVRITVEDTPLDTNESVQRFVEAARQARPDGLLLVPFHHPAFRRVDTILRALGARAAREGGLAEARIPTIILTSLGVHHGSVRAYRRPGVHLIQSLDNFEAAEYGLRMVQTAHWLRHSRILSVAGSAAPREARTRFWRTTVKVVPLQRFVAEVERTEVTDAVRGLARSFRRNARRVVEPRRPEILTAARVHFAIERMLADEQADAITMDCLRRGELLPCMSFMTLRDEGTAAGCENDLDGTLTLMLAQQLFDRPGFQHNPCYETESNHYFASHCTSASRLFGTRRPREPYLLRSYAHNNDPTCVPQVLWRGGEDVTMARYISGTRPQMLIYSGTVVRSYAMPPVGGCRTNVEITINELPDARDVRGHHNVLFCGNHARRLRQFARFLGIAVVP